MRRLCLALLLVAGCGPAAGDRLGADRLGAAPDVRTVSLSGRFVTVDRDRPPRGAYGLRVHLLFRRADGSGWEGARAPDGPARRHRTFDVLGEDGRFRFDLATAADLSAYDEVAVVPATDTEAVRLVPAPRGAGRLRTPGGPVTVLPPSAAIRVPLPASGPVAAAGLEAEVDPGVGVVARWAALSREFVVARYGGDVPFELPPVQVELSDGGGYVFQAFDPDALGGHEIELNVARGVTPSTMAHEYGHYVNFQMWGESAWRYTLRNRDLREGWAIFFSFAVRAYAAQAYGDLELAASNPERAPFTHRLGEGVPRYEGISYGRSRPTRSAIAALLWSLYDGPEPSPFEYDGAGPGSLLGDNDDLALGLTVIEAVRRTRSSVFDEAGAVEVVRAIKAEADPALHASIDDAVAFFLCPEAPDCDVKAPPGPETDTAAPTLRPVSPGSLRAVRTASGVRLTWDRRLYAAPWANAPEAYRVYRDGVLIGTRLPAESDFLDREATGAHVYEVRAVGGGGEAAGAPSVRVAPASERSPPRRP
ncbi:MAG: hypothetical protein AAF845_08235 [Bacteroidota bacterium]